MIFHIIINNTFHNIIIKKIAAHFHLCAVLVCGLVVKKVIIFCCVMYYYYIIVVVLFDLNCSSLSCTAEHAILNKCTLTSSVSSSVF